MIPDAQAFRRHAIAVLQKVFDQRSIDDPSGFVVSASYELRKALKVDDDMDLITVCRRRLPEWMRHLRRLGPYEQTILCQLLFEANDISIFRGGTGSGKTSLVWYLAQHIARAAVLDRWEDHFACKTFFAIIDLQTVTSVMKERAPQSNKDRVAVVLQELNTSITITLDNILPEDVGKWDTDLFSSCLWNKEEIGSFRTTAVEGIRTTLRRLWGQSKDAWKAQAIGNQFRAYNDLVERLTSQRDRVFANLLPFVRLGQRHMKMDRRLLLVVDNIDQLPVHLQGDIFSILRDFFASSTTRESGFAVTVFLRLSSSIDPINRTFRTWRKRFSRVFR